MKIRNNLLIFNYLFPFLDPVIKLYNPNLGYNNLYKGYYTYFCMSLIQFLKKENNARKIFGKRELKIIEKQLFGLNLTQSEKNRLSRDIRKKLEFIKTYY